MIESLGDLEDLVTAFVGHDWHPHGSCLFRGQSRAEWTLAPRVLRQDFCDAAKQRPHGNPRLGPNDQFLHLAHYLSKQFFVSAARHLPRECSTSELYFQAQHHGLPTLLLDWTESPLVALFFAIHADPNADAALFAVRSGGLWIGPESDGCHGLSDDDPLVGAMVEWAMTPTRPIEHQKLKLYPHFPSPSAANLSSKESEPERGWLAMPVYPRWSQPRLLFQRSAFTLHQTGRHGDLVTSGLVGDDFLKKWVIPARVKALLRQRLYRGGIHEGSLFADLAGEVQALLASKGIQARG